MRRGAGGPLVRELHDRLGACGFPTRDVDHFGDPTEVAVRAFQRSRGLRVDGVCGRETWTALVEAGYRLGDRLLYRRRPMLRGDDVADLQARLNALGFDAGREDGIFGPDSEAALREFQRNAGLADDGVLGPGTRETLDRLGGFAAGSVASVREREALRVDLRTLADSRVYVAADPGFEVLGDQLVRRLSSRGAEVLLDTTGRAAGDLAQEANRWPARVALGIRAAHEPGSRCYYYANRSFRSESGYLLARALDGALGAVLGEPGAPIAGRTFNLLRETRMAAVVCEPVRRGDPAGMRTVVTRAPELADAIAAGIQEGLETAAAALEAFEPISAPGRTGRRP